VPTSPICVDASVVVRLVAHPSDVVVRELWDAWDREARVLIAPTLLYYEVSNALYQYLRHGLMSVESARMALRAALALPVQMHGEPAVHADAVAMAERHKLTATYDAHYLVLAAQMGAEFWTLDHRLVEAVSDRLPWVRLAVES
jgi:predicted nucleic acid-binding protein